jgi:hypothetical protein
MVDDTSERAHPFQLHHHHEYLYFFSLVLGPGSANTSATMPAMQYFPKARSDFELSSVTAWDESCRLVYLSRTAAYMRLAG